MDSLVLKALALDVVPSGISTSTSSVKNALMCAHALSYEAVLPVTRESAVSVTTNFSTSSSHDVHDGYGQISRDTLHWSTSFYAQSCPSLHQQ